MVPHVATLQKLVHRCTSMRTSCKIIGKLVQHHAGHPTPHWTQCYPRQRHIDDSDSATPLSHLPRTLTLVATRICHSVSHSTMTTAHRVISVGVVHHPCAIVPPTSPSGRPLESSLASRHYPSIQGVGTLQRAFPGAIHAIVHSNPHIGLKKCKLLFMHTTHE